MKLPFAKWSGTEITVMLILSIILAFLLYSASPFLMIIPLALFGFTLYFFRDPERNVPEGNLPDPDGVVRAGDTIVSPADGTIIEIVDVAEDTFIKEASVKIAIFLSVFNVHINRSPVSGRVMGTKHFPGKKMSAFKKTAE